RPRAPPTRFSGRRRLCGELRRERARWRLGLQAELPAHHVFSFAGRDGAVGQLAMYAATLGGTRYVFPDLRSLLARASPLRSGDALAGVAARTAEERVAAQMAL